MLPTASASASWPLRTRLGQTRQQAGFMFDLGLLHDIGVSSTRTHQHLVSEFDWAGSQQHCITGASLLAGFARWPPWQPVRYHHTQWENCWRSLTSRPAGRAGQPDLSGGPGGCHGRPLLSGR
jgi:hypothetical protein